MTRVRTRALALAVSIGALAVLAVFAVLSGLAGQPLHLTAYGEAQAAHVNRAGDRAAAACRIADRDDHAWVLRDRVERGQAAEAAAQAAAAEAQRAAQAEAAARAAAAQAAQAAQAAAAARAAQAALAQAAPARPAPTPAPAAAPPSQSIQAIITSAFSPLGSGAVTWALRVASCESGYNPNAVNPSSGASGLFQFLRSTWAGTPYAASSPFDPVANARAAAWLYARSGPGQWSCK